VPAFDLGNNGRDDLPCLLQEVPEYVLPKAALMHSSLPDRVLANGVAGQRVSVAAVAAAHRSKALQSGRIFEGNFSLSFGPARENGKA
jgi:hypothetical protein